MHIELTEAELDYIARVLLTRPMGEVEPIMLRLRGQVAHAQSKTPAGLPEGVARAGNGADDELLSLP